jgi:hypothetical protein
LRRYDEQLWKHCATAQDVLAAERTALSRHVVFHDAT